MGFLRWVQHAVTYLWVGGAASARRVGFVDFRRRGGLSYKQLCGVAAYEALFEVGAASVPNIGGKRRFSGGKVGLLSRSGASYGSFCGVALDV